LMEVCECEFLSPTRLVALRITLSTQVFPFPKGG
jgi:hypothetical protein